MVARRFVPRLSVLAALAVFLTACSQAPSPGVAPPSSSGSKEPEAPRLSGSRRSQAARKEGAVVVVTHTNLLYRDLIEAFKVQVPRRRCGARGNPAE